MSTKIKKIISVVLAAIMMLSVMSVGVFAAPNAVAADSSDEIIPTIIIPGISQSVSTYCDKNGEPILDKNGKKISNGLLLIDSSDIFKDILKTIALPLVTTLLTQKKHDNLQSSVNKLISDLFSIQRSDKNGNPVNNLVVDYYPMPLSQYPEYNHGWFYRMLPMEPAVEELTNKYGVDAEDYIFLYTFPLIGNPLEAGAKLFDYIDMVKEKTGASKVNIVSISLGGTIMSSYCDLVMERGGDFSDINKFINVVACLDGTDLLADFFDRNWNLEDDFLYGSFIPAVVEANGMEKYMGHLINIALRILPKDALYAVLTGAFEGILDNLIVNCPQFWAMVPSDRYESIADKYLSGAEYATLRAKTDRFQEARLDLKSNLQYAHDNYGVDVYTVTGYGLQYDVGDYNFLGITGSSRTSNSDAIIDIDSASLGATYAVAGEKLAGATSPDGEIDASTCLFPDTTWFFYKQHHEVGRDDVVIKLLANILSGDVTDVNSDPNFPQYNWNRHTRSLTRPNGLIDKAEEVIANADGVYTAEQIAIVEAAYNKAQAMLEKTLLTEDSAAEAKAMTEELNDALAEVGIGSKTQTESFFTRLLNSIFEKLDNIIMDKVGGQGYADKSDRF